MISRNPISGVFLLPRAHHPPQLSPQPCRCCPPPDSIAPVGIAEPRLHLDPLTVDRCYPSSPRTTGSSCQPSPLPSQRGGALMDRCRATAPSIHRRCRLEIHAHPAATVVEEAVPRRATMAIGDVGVEDSQSGDGGQALAKHVLVGGAGSTRLRCGCGPRPRRSDEGQFYPHRPRRPGPRHRQSPSTPEWFPAGR